MLPNLGIDVFPDQMDFFQVLPRGPGKCTIRGGSFARPDGRREMKVARYLAMRINRQVQREDEFLCKRVQRGLASSSYEPGPLSTARELHVGISRLAARADSRGTPGQRARKVCLTAAPQGLHAGQQ